MTDDSHYKTYPHGFTKRELNQLKRQAFLYGRQRLDPTQETDESSDESKLDHKSGKQHAAHLHEKEEPAAAAAVAAAATDDAGQAERDSNSRRNSEDDRPSSSCSSNSSSSKIASSAAAAATPGSKPRSTMKQLFGNFRQRAKSENRAGASSSTEKSEAKRRRQASGGGGGGGSGGGGSGGRHSVSNDDDFDLEQQQQQQQEDREKSPMMGGLVTKLRQLAAGDERRRKSSAGNPPVHGLPHPADMPLDHSHLVKGKAFAASASKRSRIRKTVSVDVSALASSNPCSPITTVQDAHKDLFEILNQPSYVTDGTPKQKPEHSGRQRHLSGPAMGQSGQDYHVTENEKYLILRSKSLAESSKDTIDSVNEASQSQPDRVFALFALRHQCYDLIPTSSKLLVFDHQLNVKKAFFALVYNGLRAAPLWDSELQQFVGMLTITDFIKILHKLYRSALVPMEELETQTIADWRSQLQLSIKPFLWISPEATVLDAVRLLLHARVHRLPVVETLTGNVLFIMTHKRILKFLHLHLHQLPLPQWFDKSLIDLQIGTFDGVCTISKSATLVQALSLFVQHRVSALPVLDERGNLVDIYSKFDVINLAATKTYNNLEVTVEEALKYRGDQFEGVSTCRRENSLKEVVEKLVAAEVHRLVMVDGDHKVVGVVSLSDILQAMLLIDDVAE